MWKLCWATALWYSPAEGQCDFIFLLFVKQRRSNDDLTRVMLQSLCLWSLDAFVSRTFCGSECSFLGTNWTICFSSILTGWFQKQTVPFFVRNDRISHNFFCFIMSCRRAYEMCVLSQNDTDGQLIVKLQCIWDYGHMSFNLMSKQYDFWC